MCVCRCEMVRSVDSGHCRLCGRCVYRRDHHCLFLARCVAANTRPLFVSFLVICVALLASVEHLSAVCLRRRHGALLDGRVMADVFYFDVDVWPICVLDALAAVLMTAVLVQQLANISAQSQSGQQSELLTVKQRFHNVIAFFVGHDEDQRDCII